MDSFDTGKRKQFDISEVGSLSDESDDEFDEESENVTSMLDTKYGEPMVFTNNTTFEPRKYTITQIKKIRSRCCAILSKFICPECHDAFTTRRGLEGHIRTVHLQITRFPCPNKPCKFIASSKLNLRKHIQANVCDQDLSKTLKCPAENCGKIFSCIRRRELFDNHYFKWHLHTAPPQCNHLQYWCALCNWIGQRFFSAKAHSCRNAGAQRALVIDLYNRTVRKDGAVLYGNNDIKATIEQLGRFADRILCSPSEHFYKRNITTTIARAKDNEPIALPRANRNRRLVGESDDSQTGEESSTPAALLPNAPNDSPIVNDVIEDNYSDGHQPVNEESDYYFQTQHPNDNHNANVVSNDPFTAEASTSHQQNSHNAQSTEANVASDDHIDQTNVGTNDASLPNNIKKAKKPSEESDNNSTEITVKLKVTSNKGGRIKLSAALD